MVHLTVCTTVIARGHHIEHAIILTILERCINRHMVTIGLHGLTNLLLIDICHFCQLADRRMTLILLLKLVDFVVNLIQRTYLVQRQTDNTALLSNSLEDALTNPPYGIRDKLKTSCLVKFLGCLD